MYTKSIKTVAKSTVGRKVPCGRAQIIREGMETRESNEGEEGWDEIVTSQVGPTLQRSPTSGPSPRRPVFGIEDYVTSTGSLLHCGAGGWGGVGRHSLSRRRGPGGCLSRGTNYTSSQFSVLE